ncbi:MAG: leucine--tRNA ligase [Candidatus Paceibacterota bacterium]|jgi:leucyl-tRNA synthetase
MKKRKAYNPKALEAKWQKYWISMKTFKAADKGKKKLVLVEFPYPSGAGLHMGHMRPFIAGDVTSKYYRLQGFDVMYPMGWDAFGLPAENYAIKNKVHPSISTAKNVANAKKQLLSWGTGYDWTREINTTDPSYYKWTQKIFLEFFKSGLAYESTGLINWCPKDKTGLANEEVVEGKCERCGTVVEKKSLRQWYLKITEYAEKLLEGLKNLPEWPEPVKIQQENWIGKSIGALVKFPIVGSEKKINVFTTRIDTIFSGTFVVLAPENPLVKEFSEKILNLDEVTSYVEEVKNRPEADRTNKENKTGVELKGIKVLNPATNEDMPVWVSDFVLGSYGTGAVFADAHDERDFDMAKTYGIPLKTSIRPEDEALFEEVRNLSVCYEGEGKLFNSAQFDGLTSAEARPRIIAWLKEKGFAEEKISYKLRDWVFSRQRYWGEPIPLIHCEKCGVVPVPDKDLPVKLPSVKNYEPTGTGESPLAAIDKWVNTKCPVCKGKAKRETNTMPQWAGSSWYWLRYMDPKNKKEFASKKLQQYWSPVDLYFGGMEHTTLHLLYSRFWNLMLYDRGLVEVKEPYKKRVPHGIILGPDGEKMSKSLGNVVNPDDVIALYGADTTRLYMMFLGPHGAQVAWNDKGIVGCYRFLERVFNMQDFISKTEPKEVTVALQKVIKKVTGDLETTSFNTAVSAMMIFANTVYESKSITKKSYEEFLKLLSPFTPHITEEIWSILGNKKSIYLSKWPVHDESLIADEKIIVVIQVNGKTRGELLVSRDLEDEEVKGMALLDSKVLPYIEGKEVRKVIVVKNRLINLVV